MSVRVGLVLAGLIASAALMQACSRPLPPQASCDFVQNPEVQRLSWKGHIPVQLYLHTSVPTQAYPSIERAVDEYNKKVGEVVFAIAARGASGPLDPQRDGVSMIYWYPESWDPAKPTEQARTTIYWTGNEISEADMRINAFNFNYNFSPESNFANLDLQSLVVHELGHVLGLAHNQLPGSVMHPILDQGVVRRALGAADLNNLKCEYTKGSVNL